MRCREFNARSAVSATTRSSATAEMRRRERPPHGSTDQKTWYSYVFSFENPKGLHQEFWQHVLGCRQWLMLERNTATNQTATSRAARDLARTREAITLGEAVTK